VLPYNFPAVQDTPIKGEAETIAMRWEIAVQEAVSRVRGQPVQLHLPEEQRYRLLVLRTWVLRYRVSLDFILETLLSYYQRVIRRYGSSHGIGLSLPTLCGHRSQEILEVAILAAFPNNENEDQWRAEKRHQLLSEISFPPNDDSATAALLEDSLVDYVSRMAAVRLKRDRESRRLSRRPWRWNPWR
jgi:hypothetical protein